MYVLHVYDVSHRSGAINRPLNGLASTNSKKLLVAAAVAVAVAVAAAVAAAVARRCCPPLLPAFLNTVNTCVLQPLCLE